MKYFKKQAAFILALCLSVSCLTPLAAKAAETKIATGFSDITDSETAVNVEVLRIMGVLDGYGDGTFRPNTTLTRAQFCKMAVLVMNGADQVAQYKNYTIFPDVRASHWAAGYVNMAVRSEKKIIAGFADGTFGPDKPVTMGQAITILMRLLGYEDKDVAAVWPDGYISKAATVGLTAGLTVNGWAAVTRGQAAQLFATLLDSKTKAGAVYGSTIAASNTPNVVLLSSNAKTADGAGGGMLISNATPYQMKNKPSNGLLNGRKGTLLLDGESKVITFVPAKNTNAKTFTVSRAENTYLMDAAGNKYSVDVKTDAYYRGEKKTYTDVVGNLQRPGAVVTICYSSSGKADYVYVDAELSSDAVVVASSGSTVGFDALTGGNVNYQIYKNGAPAGVGDLRQYDVATYSPATGILHISDTRLTGCLENVYPNMAAASEVTLFGQTFSVLPSGVGDFAKLKLGEQVTLLLTSDGAVAGAMESSYSVRNNAVGLVKSVSASAATVQLLNGLEVKGNPQLTENTAGALLGQLVTVSSSKSGYISLSRLSSSGASGDLDVAARKLGSRALADNVTIYEKVGNSRLKPITLSQLNLPKVYGSQISYVRYDWADRVSILVLDDVTGDSYTYGKASFTPAKGGSDWGYTNATISVISGDGKSAPITSTAYECGSNFTDGEFIGIIGSADDKKLAGNVVLKELENVPNSAWNGDSLVTVQGTSYVVADNVLCYNKTSGTWMTLGAARAYAKTADLYYDKNPNQGGKIRVLVVK